MEDYQVVLLVLIPISLLVIVVVLWKYCGPKKATSKVEATLKARVKENEKKDKPKIEMAMSSSEKLLKELDIGMKQDRVLPPNIGARRRKVFFLLLSTDNYDPYILSMAEVPGSHKSSITSCRDHLIKYFSKLQRLSHKYLQPVHTLCLCSKEGKVLAGGVVSGDVRGHKPLLDEGKEMPEVANQQVATIEKFHEKGSLKDFMHQVSPTTQREDKYPSNTTPLPVNKVATFGRQILEAMLFLYDQLPPTMLPLNFVRLENVYMDRGTCRLGGYTNTILGYISWLSQEINKAGHDPSSVDVIMFGHVMYYMCTGGDMKVAGKVVVLPEEQHFEEADEKFRGILRYIFKMKNNKIKHSLKEIFRQKFFSGSSEDPEPSSESDGEENGFLSKAKNWVRSRAPSIPTVKSKSGASSSDKPAKPSKNMSDVKTKEE